MGKKSKEAKSQQHQHTAPASTARAGTASGSSTLLQRWAGAAVDAANAAGVDATKTWQYRIGRGIRYGLLFLIVAWTWYFFNV